MRIRILAAAGVAAALLGPAVARAQDIPVAPDQIIANRKAGQDLLSGIAALLKQARESKVTDVKAFKDAGTGIENWMKVFPTQFPAGTDKGNTKALPAVWSDRAGFEQIAARLSAAGGDISKAAAANDAAAFDTAVGTAFKACGDCHHTYKAK